MNVGAGIIPSQDRTNSFDVYIISSCFLYWPLSSSHLITSALSKNTTRPLSNIINLLGGIVKYFFSCIFKKTIFVCFGEKEIKGLISEVVSYYIRSCLHQVQINVSAWGPLLTSVLIHSAGGGSFTPSWGSWTLLRNP